MDADAAFARLRLHAHRGRDTGTDRGIPHRQVRHAPPRDDRHDHHGLRVDTVQPSSGRARRPDSARHSHRFAAGVHAAGHPAARVLRRLYHHRAWAGAGQLAAADDDAQQLVRPQARDGDGAVQLHEPAGNARDDPRHSVGDRPGVRAHRVAYHRGDNRRGDTGRQPAAGEPDTQPPGGSRASAGRRPTERPRGAFIRRARVRVRRGGTTRRRRRPPTSPGAKRCGRPPSG